MATISLRDEAAELLQRLIRLDTVNPPGNETQAAELLREYLEANGVQFELYAQMPERANLVARIPGSGDGPRLLLLSHTDTVLADPAEWQVDPWSGELRDGEIWGRGALDMKGEVAASAVAIASLAREGFQPAGDLIFVAAADEELGDGYGLQWLCEAHPEAVRAEYSVNEGAGDRLELGGRVFYVCRRAEKMSSPFILRVHGRSGPRVDAGHRRQRAREGGACSSSGWASCEPAPRLEPETERVPRGGHRRGAGRGRGARPGAAVDPLAAEMIEPLLSLTVSPTMVEASQKRNVIPALCEVTVDCRIPPGPVAGRGRGGGARVPGRRRLRLRVDRGAGRDALADGHAALGRDRRRSSSESEPGAQAVPLIVPGFTDSHWVRERVRHGRRTASSRCATMDAETAARLIHSADERVPVDDLELGCASSGTRPSSDHRAARYAFRDGRGEDPARRHGARRTACSCTGRPRGPAPSATPTGGPNGRSGEKPLQAAALRNPLLRGPARLAEIFALLPRMRRRAAGGAAAVRARIVAGLDGRGAAVLHAARAAQPAAPARAGGRRRRRLASRRRCSRCAAASSPPTTAPSTSRSARYEHDEPRAREHERCGTHLVGPLLARAAVGNVIAARRRSSSGRQRAPAAAVGSLAAATEIFNWMSRHPDHPRRPRARAARPRVPAPLRHRRADAASSSRWRRPRSTRVSISRPRNRRGRTGPIDRARRPRPSGSRRDLRPARREDAGGLLHGRVLQPHARRAARRRPPPARRHAGLPEARLPCSAGSTRRSPSSSSAPTTGTS